MVTMTSADKALKTLYLGVVKEQLNTETNPFLAKINQTTADVWGKEIRRVIKHGVNGGVGAGDETGDLPTAAGNNYEQLISTLKNLYGTIEISDKAIRASENDAGAFVNLLNAEMEGLVKASSFNFSRMLFGDGTGVLTTAVSASGNTITVADAKNLFEGMVVDLVDASSKEAVVTARRITAVDKNAKTITLNGETIASGTVANGMYICVQGSYKKEITGLGAIFGAGDLYGLSRKKNTWLNPLKVDNVGEISETVIQKAIDDLADNVGSKVNFIVCSSGVKRAFQKHLSSYKRNLDVMELNGGYKALSYNGIPIVSDRFCPSGTMYLLNTDDFALHQLCDWKWLEDEDGKVLRQKAGKPTYTATLVKYADLVCTRPCGQARLSGITEE